MNIKPIKPSEVAQAAIPQRVIEQINNLLRRPWDEYERLTGRWYGIHQVDAPVVAKIVDTYLAEGWRVVTQSDPRGGDFIVFSPPFVVD